MVCFKKTKKDLRVILGFCLKVKKASKYLTPKRIAI